MGFALCQENNGTNAIITCGSKSFTSAQQRYAIIKLECLAIIRAIQKFEFYLKGLQNFIVATNHRPLVGTFEKGISELTNPRLQRLAKKNPPHSRCAITGTNLPRKWRYGHASRHSASPPCDNHWPSINDNLRINQQWLSAMYRRHRFSPLHIQALWRKNNN